MEEVKNADISKCFIIHIGLKLHMSNFTTMKFVKEDPQKQSITDEEENESL